MLVVCLSVASNRKIFRKFCFCSCFVSQAQPMEDQAKQRKASVVKMNKEIHLRDYQNKTLS